MENKEDFYKRLEFIAQNNQELKKDSAGMLFLGASLFMLYSMTAAGALTYVINLFTDISLLNNIYIFTAIAFFFSLNWLAATAINELSQIRKNTDLLIHKSLVDYREK